QVGHGGGDLRTGRAESDESVPKVTDLRNDLHQGGGTRRPDKRDPSEGRERSLNGTGHRRETGSEGAEHVDRSIHRRQEGATDVDAEVYDLVAEHAELRRGGVVALLCFDLQGRVLGERFVRHAELFGEGFPTAGEAQERVPDPNLLEAEVVEHLQGAG